MITEFIRSGLMRDSRAEDDPVESRIDTLTGGDVVKVLSVFNSFLKNERENIAAFSMPWRRRLWCYRRGFYSYSKVLYGLNRQNVDDYVSDLERRKANSINQTHWKAAQLKIAFHDILSHNHSHHVTDIVATIQDGKLYPHPSTEAVDSVDDLLAELTVGSSLIVKPASGWGGSGIFSISRTESGFSMEGESVGQVTVAAKLKSLDGYILDRAESQAAYADSIYPHSTNTLRLLTMIDPDTRDPFLGAVVHRFGTESSQPVDNWSAGGVCSSVEPDTGRIGPAVAKPKAGSPTFLEFHPDTGTRIEGTEVPAWSTVREQVLSVADEYKHLWRYLGWDVVVTDSDGSITIIEANARPDVDLMQVHGPLLTDNQVRQFFRYHDVI